MAMSGKTGDEALRLLLDFAVPGLSLLLQLPLSVVLAGGDVSATIMPPLLLCAAEDVSLVVSAMIYCKTVVEILSKPLNTTTLCVDLGAGWDDMIWYHIFIPPR